MVIEEFEKDNFKFFYVYLYIFMWLQLSDFISSNPLHQVVLVTTDYYRHYKHIITTTSRAITRVGIHGILAIFIFYF